MGGSGYLIGCCWFYCHPKIGDNPWRIYIFLVFSFERICFYIVGGLFIKTFGVFVNPTPRVPRTSSGLNPTPRIPRTWSWINHRILVTRARNAYTCTKCQYVSSLPDGQSILYSNSRTRCKYVAVFLRPVNAVLIMLLIMYFTTDRLLLSTFVL